MNKKELIESGVLELYAMGMASEEEVKMVESFIIKDPSLRNEIMAIENALEAYAKTTAVNPKAEVKTELFKKIKDTTPPKGGDRGITGLSIFLIGLLSIVTMALTYTLFLNHKNFTDLRDSFNLLNTKCDSIQNAHQPIIETYDQLKASDNNILQIKPTEKYPETNLYFINNSASQRNFIQIKSLPVIAGNQSYQLWSLKGDQAIPLDVFQGDGDKLIEVQFEPGTDAYAITIEPFGGQDSPTLENLIGVIPLS
jgi:anti-sigma-K factor RskA